MYNPGFLPRAPKAERLCIQAISDRTIIMFESRQKYHALGCKFSGLASQMLFSTLAKYDDGLYLTRTEDIHIGTVPLTPIM